MSVSGDSELMMSDEDSDTIGTEPASPNAAAEAVAKVQRYFDSPEEWLEGRTEVDAIDDIDNARFEIARLLDEEAGDAGRRFKETVEYSEGLAKLAALKQQHEAAAVAAADAAAQPAAAALNADSPLGPHGTLLGLLSNAVFADTRNFQVLLSGLRSEASKGEHEAEWKAAGLALYRRHQQASTGLVTATFEEAWAAAVDRRLDKRVITHYARLSDPAGFRRSCRELIFGDAKSDFSEVELRDYFLLSRGDTVVRVQGCKGTAIWWMRKWKCDENDRTLQHSVLTCVQTLYIDRLNQLRSTKDEVANDASMDQDERAKEVTKLDKLIAATSKKLSAYGNQFNKNVTALIVSQLEAYALEVDPFDEDRLLFAFTNKVYNLKTRTFVPHFKFDFVLTNCGREWREPNRAQKEKVRSIMESIMPDEDERRMLVSVLRNGLSGVRPELFIILTGEGRNGKSLLVEWIQFLVGEYGHPGKITVLTEKQKSGPDTEMANQHKKRIVVYSEPEEQALEALRLSMIKYVTGNETVNARGLFTSRDKTEMHALQLLECNKLPAILGDKGESARERVTVIHFPFTFTSDAAKLASDERATDDDLGITLTEKKYKQKDESLKSRTFKEDHYAAFFSYLVDTYPSEAEDGVGVYVTDKAKQRAGKYLDGHDLMPAWVSEHYDDVDPSEQAFVAIKDLFYDFKMSDQYQNLSKRERTLMNEKKFRSAISKSARYKPKYREKEKVRLCDGRYNTKDGLVDVKKTPHDEPVAQ